MYATNNQDPGAWEVLRKDGAAVLQEYAALPTSAGWDRTNESMYSTFKQELAMMRPLPSGSVVPQSVVRPPTKPEPGGARVPDGPPRKISRKTSPNVPIPPPVLLKFNERNRETGLLRFYELGLVVSIPGEGKTRLANDFRWHTYHGLSDINRVTKCGNKLDVFWLAGAVLFMKEKGVIEEVFVDERPIFEDVRWDGTRVWIATRNDGIWLVKPDGKMEGKVTEADGLPPANGGLLLCEIDPGHVIAVGSHGEAKRGWIADIRWEKSKATVNVFHKADHVVPADLKWHEAGNDPQRVFRPEWIHRVDGADGPSQVLIGRRAPWMPLVVDLKALSVKCSPFFAHPVCASTSRGWIGVQDFSVRLYPPDTPATPFHITAGRELCADRPDRDEVGHQGQFKPVIMQHSDGYWYVPGGTWWRIDPKTMATERLVSFRVPQQVEGLRYSASAHYGMIGWDNGKFYQVQVQPGKMPTAPAKP
jgi:hypothetical protein